MKKSLWVLCLCSCVLVGQFVHRVPAVSAESVEATLNAVYRLMNKGQIEEALASLEDASLEDPGQVDLVIVRAVCHLMQGHYDLAMEDYIGVMKAAKVKNLETPVQVHAGLFNVYDALGTSHYYSEELCSRIIYHLHKLIRSDPTMSRDKKTMDTLRKMLQHHDLAKLGTKMIQGDGDGEDFELFEDGISADMKRQAKEIARKTIADYDAFADAAMYQTKPSDMSDAEIIELMQQRMDSLSSIHFKYTESLNPSGLREVYYQEPNLLKVSNKKESSLFRDGSEYTMYVDGTMGYDNGSALIENQNYLEKLFVPNLSWIAKNYNYTVKKFIRAPGILYELYGDSPTDHLYLLSAELKEGGKKLYYYLSKLEFIVDTHKGLVVAYRHYWSGNIGYGIPHQLAADWIVEEVESRDELVFPKKGRVMGYLQETVELTGPWSVELLKVNEPLNPEIFGFEGRKIVRSKRRYSE